jgi:hypothetical protein
MRTFETVAESAWQGLSVGCMWVTVRHMPINSWHDQRVVLGAPCFKQDACMCHSMIALVQVVQQPAALS